MKISFRLLLPVYEIKTAPITVRTIPMNSILLNRSFKKLIPSRATKMGVRLERNDTTVGFSTISIERNSVNAANNSRKPTIIRRYLDLAFRLFISFIFFEYIKYKILHTKANPNQ